MVELTIDEDPTCAGIPTVAGGLDRVSAQHGHARLLENASGSKLERSALWLDLGFASSYWSRILPMGELRCAGRGLGAKSVKRRLRAPEKREMGSASRGQMSAMGSVPRVSGTSTVLRTVVCALLLVAALWAVSAPAKAAEPQSATPAFAATPANTDLDAEALRARIEVLKARTDLPSGERDLVLEQLTAALARIESADTARKAADNYAAALKAAPETIAALEAETSASAPVAPPPTSGNAGDDPVRTRLQMASLQAEAVSLRSRQRDLDDVLAAMATRPQQARAELVDLRRELDQIKTVIPANASTLLVEASRLRENAARRDLSVRIEKTEQELLTLPARESITLAQRDLGTRRLQRIDTQIEALQARITAQRQSASARQIDQARETARNMAGQSAALQAFAARTVDTWASASRASNEISATRASQESLRTRLAELAESRRSADEILDIGHIRDEYGRLLRGLEQGLPTSAALERRATHRDDRMVEVRMQRLTTQQQLRAFDHLPDAARALLAEAGQNAAPDRLAVAADLIERRRAALTDLQQIQSQHIEALAETGALDAELVQRTQQLRSLLDERLLWLPSAEALDASWFRQLSQGAMTVLAFDHWMQLPAMLGAAVRARWLVIVLLVGAIASLIITRRRQMAALERLAAPVGQRHDSFRVTLAALLVTVLLALPVPLLIGGLGWILAAGGAGTTDAIAAALGDGLLAAGAVLLMLGVFQSMCREHGLFISHFGWDAKQTGRLGRALRLLAAVIAPAALLTTLANATGLQMLVDGLGRLGFMIGSLALALFLYRVFRPHDGALTGDLDRSRLVWRARHIWFWGLVAVPLALALLAASGYYVTAGELQGHLFSSGWISLATLIAYRVAMRGVLVAGRRTAYEQADARYAKARAEAQVETTADTGGDAMPPLPEEPEIDVVSVSQQTRALLRAISVFTLALLLWGIWKDMLPALGVFDDIVLWSQVVTGVAGATVAAVTLGDLLLGVLTIVLTAVAARNLPGFLEIAVLQRFDIDAGTRYAIGGIARYVILAAGLVIAFNRIGADWSQLQWIVAALGVGLGFGLQEIVANFISGVIILFERPVRVGDLVTIGTTSGTVTRVKMRATTITDFDNFEVLVPNKSFITETVQNWTLTSPVTRLTLKIGIGYGSDVALAQRVMLDAVKSIGPVLASPSPAVLFLGFGDSSLQFEIRAFVGRVEQRLQTQHDLYMTLNSTLKQAGIEIPFPQRDVYVRSMDNGADQTTT